MFGAVWYNDSAATGSSFMAKYVDKTICTWFGIFSRFSIHKLHNNKLDMNDVVLSSD